MRTIVPRACVPFVVVAIIYTGIMTTEGLITCEAGTFVVGEPASITCKFRTNITATQRAINMALYPPDAPKGAIGKDILLCRWSVEHRSHECHLEESTYTFDRLLWDRLTVQLPAVSYQQAGLYMCFFVPSHDTETHPCELTVVEGKDESDSGEAGEELNLPLIIIPSCVGVLLLVSCIAGIVIYKYRRPKQSRKRDDGESQPMIPIKTVNEHLESFKLTKPTLQKLVEIMTEEIKKGLDDSTRLEADIMMFPTPVTHLPDGSERGDVLVLEFDGNRLQISMVKLRGHDAKVKSGQYKVPVDKKGDNKGDGANKLFYFIADCTNAFLDDIEMPKDDLPLVFLVTFPCNAARLPKGTKETPSDTSMGQHLRNLLETSFTERRKKNRLTPSMLDPLNKLKIVAVVNDTAGTLMSVADRKSNCRIGLTVGSGFKACFVENCAHLETESPEAEKKHEMIISTELGALGENGCLEFCRTEFDKDLDEQSSSPGTQILEKMASGRHIGEIVRLVLEGLIRQNLFRKVPSTCALFQKSSLSMEHVVKIDDDREEPYQKTREVLDKFGVENYTDHDVENVRLICRYVCERAAFLSAAGLATLINHVNQPEVTVVVDGYLYQRHPHFHDRMTSKTQKLVNPGLKFYLVSPLRPRCVGAARIALASQCQQDPNTVKGGNGSEKPSEKREKCEKQSQDPSKEDSQEPSKEHSQEEPSQKHIQAQSNPQVVT